MIPTPVPFQSFTLLLGSALPGCLPVDSLLCSLSSLCPFSSRSPRVFRVGSDPNMCSSKVSPEVHKQLYRCLSSRPFCDRPDAVYFPRTPKGASNQNWQSSYPVSCARPSALVHICSQANRRRAGRRWAVGGCFCPLPYQPQLCSLEMISLPKDFASCPIVVSATTAYGMAWGLRHERIEKKKQWGIFVLSGQEPEGFPRALSSVFTVNSVSSNVVFKPINSRGKEKVNSPPVCWYFQSLAFCPNL